jgi:hypothetical protein
MKKIFEEKVLAQTTKKYVIPCLSRVLKLQVSNSGFIIHDKFFLKNKFFDRKNLIDF